MALLSKYHHFVILSEEKNLSGRRNGWTADGDDVYTRCSYCHKIMRIRDVPMTFRDGRVTCAKCQRCGKLAVYVFCGLKSEKPHLRRCGTYAPFATDGGQCAGYLDGQTCSCGGTRVTRCDIPRHPDSPRKTTCYCLSCRKKGRFAQAGF